jgi:hypothetical protein
MSHKYSFSQNINKNNINNGIGPITPITDKKYITFYQFCQIMNPYSKKYETRKCIFSQEGELIKCYENDYSAKDIEKFIRRHKTNKYCTYAVNSISMIDMPTENDMIIASSSLTNGDGITQYGPAKF